MDNFYIYRHIRLDTGLVFYVGKGHGSKKRAQNKTNRNIYWKRIEKRHGRKVEILIENLTEQESFIKEKEFIKYYKSLGQCEANMTMGGEGTSGLLKSENTKLKIAKSHGARPIEVFNKNGESIGVWEGISKCGRDLNVAHEAIWQILNKRNNRHSSKGLYFKYLDDISTFENLFSRSNSTPTYERSCWAGFVHTPSGVFRTLNEASNALNLTPSNISRRCSKTIITWKDWFFSFEETPQPSPKICRAVKTTKGQLRGEEFSTRLRKPLNVFKAVKNPIKSGNKWLKGEFLFRVKSIKEAANKCQVDLSSIYGVLNRDNQQLKGYIFEYATSSLLTPIS